MRLLLAAALGLVAAVTPSAPAPRTETLYSRTDGKIAAFAQDGPLISWLAPGEGGCNKVHVLSLENGLKLDLPTQSARNVTCRWDVSGPVGLAVARTSDVLWTLRESSPLAFDYLIGASGGDPRERRYQEIAHTKRGAGQWFGGVAGDRSTLAYAVTSVDYKDEAGCLAGTGTCEMEITGGGLYRVVGRQAPRLVAGTSPAVAAAVADDAAAYIPAATIGKNGRPLSGTAPVVIVSVSDGHVIARATPQGTPLAIALSPLVLALIERTSGGLRLGWYDSATGQPSGSVALPAAAALALSTTDSTAVFRVGRTVQAVDLATGKVRVVLKTAAAPIGLSLEGNRLAWAENLRGGARIRAAYLAKSAKPTP